MKKEQINELITKYQNDNKLIESLVLKILVRVDNDLITEIMDIDRSLLNTEDNYRLNFLVSYLKILNGFDLENIKEIDNELLIKYELIGLLKLDYRKQENKYSNDDFNELRKYSKDYLNANRGMLRMHIRNRDFESATKLIEEMRKTKKYTEIELLFREASILSMEYKHDEAKQLRVKLSNCDEVSKIETTLYNYDYTDGDTFEWFYNKIGNSISNFSLLNLIGLSFNYIDDNIKSIRYLDKALEILPNSATVILNKASILIEMDESEEGFELVSKINIEHPDNYRTNYWLGTYYFKMKNFTSAISNLKIAGEELYFERGIFIKLARAYENNNNLGKAIDTYNYIIEEDKNTRIAYYELAKIYNTIGDAEKAIEVIEEGLKISVDYYLYYLALAKSNALKTDFDQFNYNIKKGFELSEGKSFIALNSIWNFYVISERKYNDAMNLLGELNDLDEASWNLEEMKKRVGRYISRLNKKINNEQILSLESEKKNPKSKLGKIIKETKDIKDSVNKRKLKFLDFVTKPRKSSINSNFIEVLQRWNSFTPIVGNNNLGSKGGGLFVKIENKGFVIDPGFNFIENFRNAGYSFQDIDYVFVSHAHNDHSANIEHILTLLHKHNKKIRDENNEKNEQEIQRNERSNGESQSESSKPTLNKSEKFIKIFMASSVHSKYSGMFVFSDSTKIDIEYIFPGKTIQLDKVEVIITKAKHDDQISKETPVGFTFVIEKHAIVYTGDTGFNKTIRDEYLNLKKRLNEKEIKKENIVLIANLGGFKENEKLCPDLDDLTKEGMRNPDLERKIYEKSFYPNHLGRLGLVEVNKCLDPGICLISEFGEELDNHRVELSEIFNSVFNKKISFIPADIGLNITIQDKGYLCRVIDSYFEDSEDSNKDKIIYNYIIPQKITAKRLMIDSSLRYFDESNEKIMDLMQLLLMKYSSLSK